MITRWFRGIETQNTFTIGLLNIFKEIKSLNLDGVLVSIDDNVATMVVDYYSKLFTTSDPCNIGCVVHKVGCIR